MADEHNSGTRARRAPDRDEKPHPQSCPPEELKQLAVDPSLTEDLARALLARHDVPPDALEALTKNAAVVKHRRVLLDLLSHPKTPRHVSVPAIRHLYAFEMMHLALSPTVLADIKRAAEDAIIARLEKTTLGEKITLGRRASGRVAGALLMDRDARVLEAALDNPHLTEALVARAIMDDKGSQLLVELVCRSSKWSVRQDVRIASLRNQHTPAARAIEFARSLPTRQLRDILHVSRLPENVKRYLQAELQGRTSS